MGLSLSLADSPFAHRYIPYLGHLGESCQLRGRLLDKEMEGLPTSVASEPR